jgi:hypothetical protein
LTWDDTARDVSRTCTKCASIADFLSNESANESKYASGELELECGAGCSVNLEISACDADVCAGSSTLTRVEECADVCNEEIFPSESISIAANLFAGS